jgi:hypothetical protein
MLKDNDTPFQAIAFEQTHRDRRAMAVATARACYLLQPDGSLALSPKQALALSDVYDGPPHTSPLLKTSDLVPFRPAADVTCLGRAYSPNGEPATSWTAGLRVAGLSNVVRVHGPRKWEPQQNGGGPTWRLTPSEKAVSVALDYRLAAGGRVIGDPKGAADPRNPIGAGLVDPHVTSPYFSYDAPQIEQDSEPVRDISNRPEPAGFGAMPPAWKSRAPYFGTVDVEAIANGGPRLPGDHDYRYWQCAAPALQLPGYLAAHVRVGLGRLAPGGAAVEFAVPDVEPSARYTYRDGREVLVAMHRDGLHIDMRGDPPWPVEFTFRSWVEMCPQSHVVHLELTNAERAASLPVSGVDGLHLRECG